MSRTRKNNFMVQAAILAASSILVRLIGLVYRIPLNNILGERGMAYYGIAFDVYSILLLLSSYSIPLAVSKMVSARMATKQYRRARKIFYSSLVFSFCMGIAAFAITYFGADFFAKLTNFRQCAVALRVLSPALIIMSLLGVLRGFFQGTGSMVPTAASNIVEQIVNAVVSIVAASALIKAAAKIEPGTYDFSNVADAYGAAGGTLGTVMGALSGLIFMVFLFILYSKVFNRLAEKDENTENEQFGTILKVLILTIVPVILSTTIYNLSGLIDSTLFSNIMKWKGMEQDMIDTLTGMYSGNYRLLINVPIALSSALSASLIPSVVASMAQKSRGGVIRKVESAIKVTMLVSMPCAVGLGVLAEPIIRMLFPRSVDPEKVALMLMIGAVSVVLYSLSTVTNSILQGIDRMRVPVTHSALSLLLHVILLVLMLLIFKFDIFCVVVADMFFALFVCFLNHRSLRRYLNYKQEIRKTFALPIICSLLMGIIVFIVYRSFHSLLHSNAISVLLSILVAVLVYAAMLLVLKAVDEEELEMVPGGGRICRLAKKLHLMR